MEKIPPAATVSRQDIAADLYSYGIDAITTGDHLWDQKEVLELLQNEPRFVRPLNYPSGTPGRGSTVLKIRDLPPIAVMNAQGRTFMPPLENPFLLAMEEAKWLRQHTNIIFVDFHAEATSEKIAFARMLDGQVMRRRRHTHACADGRRTDFSWRYRVFDRRRVYRPARKRFRP